MTEASVVDGKLEDQFSKVDSAYLRVSIGLKGYCKIVPYAHCDLL